MSGFLRKPRPLIRIGFYLLASWLAADASPASPGPVPPVRYPAPVSVTTYHYDNHRLGWNYAETTLRAASFPADFGVLQTVAVDGQVDAQPLLLPGRLIAGGVHDVLYVVTSNNSVYGLDARSGAVLVSRNLGPPVPYPLGCGNNALTVGITSTPVIDVENHRLIVMAYVNGMPPQYRLHSLNLSTLADAVAPVTVAASHTLTDGSTFTFDATYQRQRPALLLEDGKVYAGFGSFCDLAGQYSRGWVLGWDAASLRPLPGSVLNDSQASSPTDFFLSSVWMSGFGLSSNGRNIFFATGNSDCNFNVIPELCPALSTYDSVTNTQESVVAVTPDLAQRAGVFAPSNTLLMDNGDSDLGSSGVLLMPQLNAAAPELAAIVGKDGRLFLLNQNDLGTPLDVLQLSIYGSWGGPSYYVGHDGIPRVVTSAGPLQTFQVSDSPAPHWVAESTTTTIPKSIQDPGFFSVVSSNELLEGSAIIWAVGRPISRHPLTLMLYAFAATPVNGSLPLLYSGAAGVWSHPGSNANVTPLVANGLVYVAGYKTVTIFGPHGTAPEAPADVSWPAER